MSALDDDRDGIEPEAPDEDAGDPAVAFDALRRTIEMQGARIGTEMTIMRRGLEAAFDQLEKIGPPQDYKPQLAQLVQAFDSVAKRLHGIEQSPILRQGGQHHATVLQRGDEELIRNATQKLERQASDLDRACQDLSAHFAGARVRDRQNWWLVVTLAIGLLAGALAMLFLPRILPFSAAPRVASVIMGERPWQAGMSLMAFDSPEAWQRVVAADQLIEANRETVAACREAAAKAGTDQRCTITVKAPAK